MIHFRKLCRMGFVLKQTGKNLSVEKTLKIIETLAKTPHPMSLSSLADEVNMPASTVLRMVNTLVEYGYAYQEDNSRHYALTMRFLHIGQIAASHISIRDIAHPFLVDISSKTGEASCLAILETNKLRYIDVVEGSGNLVMIRQKVGGSGPMHCTGSGKLFLSQFSTEELDSFIAQFGLPSLTMHSLVHKKDLQYDLDLCRKRGYAIDDEECEIGMRCVAAPIRDSSGKIIACISVSGPITRMTRLRYESEILPPLCKAANEITKKIAGKSSNDANKSVPPM